MRYCPVPSLTADRTFSMSAGLVASTVTPGSTAPDESFTVPAMTACAEVTVGMRTTHAKSVRILTIGRIFHLTFRCFLDSVRGLRRELTSPCLPGAGSSRAGGRLGRARLREKRDGTVGEEGALSAGPACVAPRQVTLQASRATDDRAPAGSISGTSWMFRGPD